MATPKISHEVVLALLHYEPDSGEFFWRNVPKGYKGVGKRAGTLNTIGYEIIQINGKKYGAHRLAWLYCNGVWPTYHIDHINRIRHDNRIVNLRDVPHSVNMQNGPYKSATPGVTWSKKNQKWQAQLMAYGKYRYLGLFSSVEEAQAAHARGVAMYQPTRPRAEADL
jgi:hypothetical protein